MTWRVNKRDSILLHLLLLGWLSINIFGVCSPLKKFQLVSGDDTADDGFCSRAIIPAALPHRTFYPFGDDK